MRKLLAILVALSACHSSPASQSVPGAGGAGGSGAGGSGAAVAPAPASPVERLTADTPRTTVEGNRFIAPVGWAITVRGAATVLEAPEPGSSIALVDVHAKDADAAVAAAWAAHRPDAKWPLKVVNSEADREGWTDGRAYVYQTSPNERRDVAAFARHSSADSWTVLLYDMTQAVGEKRGAQVALIFGRLQPKGFERESFAGKKANRLDRARIAELGKFVTTAQEELGVPGVSLGLIQDGEVVFAGGFGVRELGKKAKVDGDTLFIVASNTKAMTTLMLARLVDEGKLGWETPVTDLLPSFKLGDAATTKSVLVKHLICACTGLPRQDLEWLFQFEGATPESSLATLATIQPTSKFGEMFQYSNGLAGAAGFVGGHVAFPKLELGAAYDKAMQTRVFGPLGMKSTTFDFRRAIGRNHASSHSPDVDGKTALAAMEVNYAIIPLRPAGGAWSSARDMLKYVAMELANGKRGGKQLVAEETLLARRAPQVAIGKDVTYGMGLQVDTTYGVPVVHHGGDLVGQHSDMIWLPEHGVGAVILTNGDPGWILRSAFSRKLLEVLFDGRAEADATVVAKGKTFFAELAADRKLMTVPADPTDAAKLAPLYANDALGEIRVSRDGAATVFDFGEWKSEVASRHNPDGSVSFLTTRPGLAGFDFVVGTGARRTLVVRDAQHEYTFTEK
ncbi:MAG TPA: serine hydrolase domain-containing protein [Kofleriaceae bacterium]|nr:serine hydrolase domain-containing protein [Kofleriaceae bacterium]